MATLRLGVRRRDRSGRRILPHGAPACKRTAAVPGYVDVVCKRRSAGRPISQFDAQIAAVALCHADRLATRNVSDFEGCGLSIVDPWGFAAPTGDAP